MPAKTANEDDDELTTFRVRLPRGAVRDIQALARRESVRRGEDCGWCDLLREALRHMARTKKPIK